MNKKNKKNKNKNEKNKSRNKNKTNKNRKNKNKKKPTSISFVSSHCYDDDQCEQNQAENGSKDAPQYFSQIVALSTCKKHTQKQCVKSIQKLILYCSDYEATR